MKKRNLIWIVLCAFLALTACGAEGEDLYRVDTVVQIPMDPTQAPTEAPEETESAPEMTAPAEETEESDSGKASSTGSKTSSSTGKSSSSGKTSSSGNKSSSSGKNSGSSKTESAKETQPAATEPPVTESPTEAPSEPVATEPPTEAPTEPPYDPSSYSVGSLEYAILDAINAYRAEEGLSELSMSTKLSGIAALRAQEIQQVWSHTRPDGRSYTSALSDYGYGYGSVTENLIYAAGPSGQQIADKWMSKDNRDSLLSASYTTAGIGIYTVGGVTYIANILVG